MQNKTDVFCPENPFIVEGSQGAMKLRGKGGGVQVQVKLAKVGCRVQFQTNAGTG